MPSPPAAGSGVVVRATTVAEAVRALRDLPGAVLVGGGTEVVVGLTEVRREGRAGPGALVTLRRVPGLRGVLPAEPGRVRLGALTTYADLDRGTGGVPVLTAMAPTVGSPASRACGTLGGALGTGSGAGDAVTALLALDAQVEVAGADGKREVPVAAWLDRSQRRPGDVVTGVAVTAPDAGSAYLKAGERQAVFYGTASCALVVSGTRVRCALGSVAPLPVRVPAAEQWACDALAAGGLPPDAGAHFGRLVTEELPLPAPGLRISAEYRRHVAGVLAGRALVRSLAQRAAS